MSRLPPPVLLLGLTAFLGDVSSEMSYPLLPGFLTVTLGAAPWVIGAVEGAAETTSAVLAGIGLLLLLRVDGAPNSAAPVA